jgi:hypothetical protein
MGLETTPVNRNLGSRVTLWGLELEDLMVVCIVAAVSLFTGNFIKSTVMGLPMNIILAVCNTAAVLIGIWVFKFGKPRGYLGDYVAYILRPHFFSGVEPDTQVKAGVIKRDED